MREVDIIRMKQSSDERVLLLYRQFQFLNSRIEAYEAIFRKRTSIFKALWNPKWLKDTLDILQSKILNEYQKQSEEIRKKREEEAQKPKLSIVSSI